MVLFWIILLNTSFGYRKNPENGKEVADAYTEPKTNNGRLSLPLWMDAPIGCSAYLWMASSTYRIYNAFLFTDSWFRKSLQNTWADRLLLSRLWRDPFCYRPVSWAIPGQRSGLSVDYLCCGHVSLVYDQPDDSAGQWWKIQDRSAMALRISVGSACNPSRAFCPEKCDLYCYRPYPISAWVNPKWAVR